jgi:hypothetical protein
LPKKTSYRQIYRWKYEQYIIDAHKQHREKDGHQHMKMRASLAEHPVGTMKNQMG